jgi:hypothetical protein
MTITLLFGVHAHQPVGNFPAVLEEAHLRCYQPFLQTLHRFPAFRFSVHFSGWLLDYLLEHHPADIELLQEMVARGQAEMFGSGWCEPVLAAIPSRDRAGQLAVMADQLERHFGARPQGSWLTERVWESTIVPALVQSGIRYVTVDDYHFLCTGKRVAELDGYYTTEEAGYLLDVFPISEELRYRLPFSPAPAALIYIEQLASEGHAAAVYFDDIEKFGIWPDTWEWVYEKRWLEQFITAVLASPRIRTATYGEFHAGARTRGIVYLPTTSYVEMNEWTLPAPAARTYAALVREHKDAHRYDDTKAFLRGGIWRNFLTRYPEANWMHKRMLALSERLARLPAERRAPGMTASLYRAQANDAYWHGLFGGLYLPHLRRAIYRNLIELESALDAVAPRAAYERLDLDCDGADELFIRSAHLQAVTRDDGLAALHELDSYPLAHNFGDTLRRSREHYYHKIDGAESRAGVSSGGIASAHDRVGFRHDISFEDIVPDALPRVLFCDRYLAPDHKVHALCGYILDAVDEGRPAIAFRVSVGDGVVRKRYELAGARLSVTYTFEGLVGGTFVAELNLSLPACDGFAGRYVLDSGTIPCGFGQKLAREMLTAITLDDRALGGALVLTASAPVALRAQPHFTVSQSEAGFEKIMQAATVILSWPVTPERSALTLSLEVAAGPATGSE